MSSTVNPISIPDPDQIRAAIDEADERARLLRNLLRLAMRLRLHLATADSLIAPATSETKPTLPSRAAIERRILALSRRGPDVGPVGDAFDLSRERIALKVLLNGDVSDRPAEAEKISPGVIARISEGRR